MYTVARFCAEAKEAVELMPSLGSAINAKWPKFYDGPDSRFPNRFSGQICKSDDWSENVSLIKKFIDENANALRSIQNSGYSAQIDVALYPKDYSFKKYLVSSFHLPLDLIRAMSQLGIDFVFSVYIDPGAPE